MLEVYATAKNSSCLFDVTRSDDSILQSSDYLDSQNFEKIPSTRAKDRGSDAQL